MGGDVECQPSRLGVSQTTTIDLLSPDCMFYNESVRKHKVSCVSISKSYDQIKAVLGVCFILCWCCVALLPPAGAF